VSSAENLLSCICSSCLYTIYLIEKERKLKHFASRVLKSAIWSTDWYTELAIPWPPTPLKLAPWSNRQGQVDMSKLREHYSLIQWQDDSSSYRPCNWILPCSAVFPHTVLGEPISTSISIEFCLSFLWLCLLDSTCELPCNHVSMNVLESLNRIVESCAGLESRLLPLPNVLIVPLIGHDS